MEMNLAKKFQYAGKWRAPGKRIFAVYNHRRNGNLIAQWFETIYERKSTHEDVWYVVESAEQKIEAFKQAAWATNLVSIPEAETAEQALAIAEKDYGMRPLEAAGGAK